LFDTTTTTTTTFPSSSSTIIDQSPPLTTSLPPIPSKPTATVDTKSSSETYNDFNTVWSDQTIILVVIFCAVALFIVSILSYLYINKTIARAKRDRAFSDWVMEGNSKINLAKKSAYNDGDDSVSSPDRSRERCTSTSLPGPVLGTTIDDLNESAHDWSVTV